MALVQRRAPLDPPLSAQVTVVPPGAHPKIVQLHDYWRRAAPPGGGLPGRKHIDPTDIPTLLEHLWLLDVIGAPPRFRYRLRGGAAQRVGLPGQVGDFMDQFFEGGATDGRLDHLRVLLRLRALLRLVPIPLRGPPQRLEGEIETRRGRGLGERALERVAVHRCDPPVVAGSNSPQTTK